MASITSTPGGTQQLLDKMHTLLVSLQASADSAETRRNGILDALKGIGYILITGQDVIGFEGWDALNEYELDE